MTNSLTKPSSCFRDSNSIKNFAISLYILDEKLTHEFIPINLPGSLPNLSILNALISISNSKFSEGVFRCDQLRGHFNDLHAQHTFGAKDTTGVIKKIKYVSTTITFH